MQQKIFLNGEYLSTDKATISCQDRGFLLGDGIFTTLKYAAGCLEFFPQHMARLSDSAACFSLSFDHSAQDLEQVCRELLRCNALLDQVAAIRITLSRGVSGRGIQFAPTGQPTLLISAQAYQPPSHPLRLTLSAIRRHSTSLVAQHKTLNYLDAIMVRHQAVEQGYDDAIICNEKDRVASTTVGNIFFVKDEQLFTPDLSCAVLPGITRAHVIALAKQQGIAVREGGFSVAAFSRAEEVFVTNSLTGIQPVAAFNQHLFSSARKTQQLSDLFASSIKYSL